MGFRIEVWGRNACFTRPEFKSERVSYDVMTPSAARGLLESIYWHPGLQYHIDKIYVLNPIQFINIRRNELKTGVFAASALTAFKSSKPLACYAGEDRIQRASLILKDVRYVIEGHITLGEGAGPEDNLTKFYKILLRRVEAGQCYSQPYFGCREFAAFFRLWDKETIPSLVDTKDLGFMLYDIDYTNPENKKPYFFRAQMVNGTIDCSDCEVFKA